MLSVCLTLKCVINCKTRFVFKLEISVKLNFGHIKYSDSLESIACLGIHKQIIQKMNTFSKAPLYSSHFDMTKWDSTGVSNDVNEGFVLSACKS